MAPYRGASVTVPACFVAGDRDLVILMNDEIYRGMPKEVPQLRTNLLLPGCGHWTQQERPEETTRAMLEFLETTAVDSSGRRR
jgi:pimeloyl-ACP methyl ester carboxylesterase